MPTRTSTRPQFHKYKYKYLYCVRVWLKKKRQKNSTPRLARVNAQRQSRGASRVGGLSQRRYTRYSPLELALLARWRVGAGLFEAKKKNLHGHFVLTKSSN